ncbi:serine hydrolase domain-containing protein [Catenuloplanes atrovinosus]|uniref:D-alanyl-D-alanine carboxypeptidase n=1 Tax=Catenuloplanes atrovinosus TaxID=137266 RepID=A0AAE3YMY3_9ACTN|nr:serine hydrolase domain-containing protein [Catenuloplanes atrovinosus]MDR7275133.1 D-alanyl-D-alanine carboxypeptidase [Catenuloplanes atrovinosus]
MKPTRRQILQAAALVPAGAALHVPDARHTADLLKPITALGVVGVLLRAHPGDIRATDGVPIDARFRIASTRKPFLATVVLQLAAEGKLTLDGPAPDLRFSIRQLLQHTTGLQDDLPGYETAEEYLARRFDVHTRAELIARATARPLAFAPGTGWRYSNAGYLMAADVVERLTGRPLRAEITTRILRPLGLRDTGFPGTSPYLPRPHARAYQQLGADLTDVTVQVPGDPDSMVSTASDLGRFFRALLGGRLLPPRWLAEMRRTVPVDAGLQEIWPGMEYGLGLMRRPLPGGGVRWGHDGGDAGFATVTGVTEGGARSVVISMSTTLAGDAAVRQQQAADRVTERLLQRT